MEKRIWETSVRDKSILRRLAVRQAEIAQLPVMAERRRLWTRHNALAPERPMILAETQGVVPEILADNELECEAAWARDVERHFRLLIFQHEHVDDDWVAEPWIDSPWQVDLGDYGVASVKHHGEHAKMGSYVWEPPIKDIERDFAKLRPRRFVVDREATYAWDAHLEALFDGILPVRRRGGFYWTLGLTWPCIELIGLENLMLYMYDQPEALHRIMGFLRDDHMALIDWLETEGLYTLNNENDYVGSGTVGYSDELPRPDWQEDTLVRARDLWALSESQETVGVSPEMFERFIFPYQLPVIERFGLSYYGCCEPVHSRWHVIRRIPNLRKVSVSPWCDQDIMAEALATDYVFCRKPNPTLVSGPVWDEQAICDDLAQTVATARGCPLELVMKDVHTLADEPLRLGHWVRLAREEAEAWSR